MNFKEWRTDESLLDRKLDSLLAQAMEVTPPEELIDRAMRRLPQPRAPRFPWWAWAVYVGFFAAALLALAYWQWEGLMSLPVLAALAAPKAVALAAQYPSIAITVAVAFFVNALVAWFVAANLMLRKRLPGVVAS